MLELKYPEYSAQTDLYGAVAKLSANGLVDTEFASRYRLQPRAGFLRAHWVGVRPLHPFHSH